MKRPDINLILNEALGKLQDGMPLEQVMAEYVENAAELAPLLEAAQKLRPPTQPIVPHGALARSRARFLQAAEARNSKTTIPFTQNHWAVNLVVAMLVVVGALFITGLGTASALPGQALYPVKRAVEQAQLAMTVNLSDKLLLEDRFDHRRIDETLRLIRHNSNQQVHFAGFLSANDGEPYAVNGISLILNENQLAAARNLAGSYVEVLGQVLPNETGVSVDMLQLRLFEISGELTQHEGDSWFISGVWFRIDNRTFFDQIPVLGQEVEITAIRLSQQDYLALSVHIKEEPGKKETEIITPYIPEDDDDQSEIPEEEITDDETDDESQAETPDDEIWYNETDDEDQIETPEVEISDDETLTDDEPETIEPPDPFHDEGEECDDTEDDLSSEVD